MTLHGYYRKQGYESCPGCGEWIATVVDVPLNDSSGASDPRRYGAARDGVTDDTAAIQAAINAASDQQLPSNPPSNAEYEGDDWECEECGHLLADHLETRLTGPHKGAFVCERCLEHSTVCLIGVPPPNDSTGTP